MDDMWITVENKRKSGDIWLGISQLLIKGFKVNLTFPQSSPHPLIRFLTENLFLKWVEICNYKIVIRVTHISTAVITTNFKYKTFSWRVRLVNLGAKA